jgi:hypothetical protein
MKINILLKQYLEPWPAMMVGIVAFVIITGGQILWPKYTDWLMVGDMGQHFLGWQFFRNSPLLQWPIGANPNFGLDIGSSVVFTDSLPLFALVFKPFNVFLPDTFQYSGLWILICFLLQSFFAWKLLELVTQDKWLRLIGCAFFTFTPVYLFHLYIGNLATFGHWVLLAAIYFYFFRSFSNLRWLSLVVLTSLIHPYLFVMVSAIWTADLLQRCWRKELSIYRTTAYFFTVSIITTIVMWAAGYFMVGAGVNVGTYGEVRMDLLTLIDPGLVWSKLLPDIECLPLDESNYLGLGMMGLVLIAIYGLIRNRAALDTPA